MPAVQVCVSGDAGAGVRLIRNNRFAWVDGGATERQVSCFFFIGSFVRGRVVPALANCDRSSGRGATTGNGHRGVEHRPREREPNSGVTQVYRPLSPIVACACRRAGAHAGNALRRGRPAAAGRPDTSLPRNQAGRSTPSRVGHGANACRRYWFDEAKRCGQVDSELRVLYFIVAVVASGA